MHDYVENTLSSDHPDRGAPRPHPTSFRETLRYLGLTILEATEDTVTFRARIFERGADRSFTERSTFVREGGAWRYASGEIIS